MAVIKSLITAFSTYSKIPMPKIEWDEKNMKYAVCFFPLIGVVIGALWFGWLILADYLCLDAITKAAVAALIPIIVSGGIHMDGFCDITDAFSSWQPKEKKLQILKDPHVGAFAIIGCGCYLLAYFGIMAEMADSIAACTAFGFVISRALSSLCLVHFKSARPKGMLDTVAKSSQKTAVTLCGIIYLLVCFGCLCLISLQNAAFVFVACVFAVALYRHLAYAKLGGTTGDMAGWFLQVCELAIPYFLVILGRILG